MESKTMLLALAVVLLVSPAISVEDSEDSVSCGPGEGQNRLDVESVPPGDRFDVKFRGCVYEGYSGMLHYQISRTGESGDGLSSGEGYEWDLEGGSEYSELILTPVGNGDGDGSNEFTIGLKDERAEDVVRLDLVIGCDAPVAGTDSAVTYNRDHLEPNCGERGSDYHYKHAEVLVGSQGDESDGSSGQPGGSGSTNPDTGGSVGTPVGEYVFNTEGQWIQFCRQYPGVGISGEQPPSQAEVDDCIVNGIGPAADGEVSFNRFDGLNREDVLNSFCGSVSVRYGFGSMTWVEDAGECQPAEDPSGSSGPASDGSGGAGSGGNSFNARFRYNGQPLPQNLGSIYGRDYGADEFTFKFRVETSGTPANGGEYVTELRYRRFSTSLSDGDWFVKSSGSERCRSGSTSCVDSESFNLGGATDALKLIGKVYVGGEERLEKCHILRRTNDRDRVGAACPGAATN